MIGWLFSWWHATQRAIDIQILWPSCKKAAAEHHSDPAEALNYAKGAFAVHAMNDPAWLCLGEEGIEIIDRLE